MLKLNTITLLCLDTRHPELADRALQKCLEQAAFAQAVLLTHAGYQSSDPRITTHAIEALKGIEDYSRFMIKEIAPYVLGSHVLVVQWDGYIVNLESWSSEFLKYDYIGAPWPNKTNAVGNGGFSLRSKKLLNALADPYIDHYHPEDSVICEDYKSYLEHTHGIQFAPVSLASQFACEMIPPIGKPFGVHSVGALYLVMNDERLRAALADVPDNVLRDKTGRDLLKNMIKSEQYHSARFVALKRWRCENKKEKLRAGLMLFSIGLRQLWAAIR